MMLGWLTFVYVVSLWGLLDSYIDFLFFTSLISWLAYFVDIFVYSNNFHKKKHIEKHIKKMKRKLTIGIDQSIGKE